jgi:hypothetical protein
VDADEVVVHIVLRHGQGVVLKLLAEGICQSREPADAHPLSEVLHARPASANNFSTVLNDTSERRAAARKLLPSIRRRELELPCGGTACSLAAQIWMNLGY